MKDVAGRGFLMDEKKLLLVFITILAITGFQVYWLRDNYFREKKALEIKANSLFLETVRQVQDSVLQKKIKFITLDDQGKAIITKDSGVNFIRGVKPDIRTAKVASLLLRKQLLKDSLKKINGREPGVIVSIHQQNGDSIPGKQLGFRELPPEDVRELVLVNTKAKHDSFNEPIDSLRIETEYHEERDSKSKPQPVNTLFFKDEGGRNVIIKIDSLFKDSVSIAQLTTEFVKVLKAERLDVPFTISTRNGDTLTVADHDEMTPRFPFGAYGRYRLLLGNTFSYLIKKITLPILFSVFLIGVTVFSFILLYRTLINQQRLAAMKNEFMSNITHELKTPIATVGVAIEALRSFGATQSPERTKEYLDISASELQRLSLLVDKVLKLSLFENKVIELRKENVDLLGVVNEVINTMKPLFEKSNATVRVKTNGDNFMLEADRLHTTSVIYNLLDNALKYGVENPVIEIALSALPNDIIELKVSDNGIGIPKEYKWRIFDKFFRVPSGNTHNVKGYGLGLSYVSEIIKRHMGFIEVESEPGKGAAFIVKIPRREADVIVFDDRRKAYRKRIHIGSIVKGNQA